MPIIEQTVNFCVCLVTWLKETVVARALSGLGSRGRMGRSCLWWTEVLFFDSGTNQVRVTNYGAKGTYIPCAIQAWEHHPCSKVTRYMTEEIDKWRERLGYAPKAVVIKTFDATTQLVIRWSREPRWSARIYEITSASVEISSFERYVSHGYGML